MVEMPIDDTRKLQIYAVGNQFTAVVVDSCENVTHMREIAPAELFSILMP